MRRDDQVRVRLMPAHLGHTMQVRVTSEEKAAIAQAAHKRGLGLGPLLRGLGMEAGKRHYARAAKELEDPDLIAVTVIERASEDAQMNVGEWLRVVCLCAIGYSALGEHIANAAAALEAGLEVTGEDD